MSAICGIVHFDDKPVSRADLETMVQSSPWRGPDGVRYHIEGSAGFAHLAFHVTPESVNERQPVLSADGRLLLAADVRLDNREELAGQLGVGRPTLSDLTDPDLLLLAYEAWGARCVERLLGDFVFAVWNRVDRELFLARDQLGGCGMVYHRQGQSLVFASETTAILDLPGVQPVINEDAVLKTITGAGLAAEETYFRELHFLAPGHWMQASPAAREIRRYWDIDPGLRISYQNEGEYSEHLLDLLDKAVECRIRSIHPIGISLSGGCDSTLLAAVAARQLADRGGTLGSFSYVFDAFPSCDERRWITPVVDQFGIEAQYINGDELWSFSDLASRPTPKDFLWTNCYAQLPEAIARAAGESGRRLLLDGMFGDALFCEPGMAVADLLQAGRWGTAFSMLWQHRDRLSWKQELFKHGLRQLLPREVRKRYRQAFPVALAPSFPGLTRERLERLARVMEEVSNSAPDLGLSPGRATRYSRVFQTVWARGAAATRGSPHNRAGVERASPYFDRRLVEFILAIPTEQLTHPGQPRKLQKDAMRRRLPAETASREGKTNFEPLLSRGLASGGVRQLFADPASSLAVQQGWIRKNWLTGAMRKRGAAGIDNLLVSQAVSLECWLRAVTTSRQGGERWAPPSIEIRQSP